MELAVRERLLAAESAGDIQALNYAYELIKSASEGLDSSDNISTDLYVLCAEQALQQKQILSALLETKQKSRLLVLPQIFLQLIHRFLIVCSMVYPT